MGELRIGEGVGGVRGDPTARNMEGVGRTVAEVGVLGLLGEEGEGTWWEYMLDVEDVLDCW